MTSKHRHLFVATLTLSLLAQNLSATDAPNGVLDLQRASATIAEQALGRGSTTIVGKNGWLFFAPDFRHLGAGPFWGPRAAEISRATTPEQADPFPAILDFKSQLDRAGIELIVVPVPPKPLIYPEDAFDGVDEAASAKRFDAADQEFYAKLIAAGVPVLDLAGEFLAHKSTTQLYCRQDTHWSGAACELAAQLLAREIRKRAWFDAVPKRTFDHESKSVEIAGDLRAQLSEPLPPKESIRLRVVGTRNGSSLAPVRADPESPVILLGDSHNLVFHAGGDLHAVGAGLPDQLALELGFAVDVVAVRGSGATPARINLLRRARAPEYLPKKKLVIWCFAAREFTESSGWALVPVVR